MHAGMESLSRAAHKRPPALIALFQISENIETVDTESLAHVAQAERKMERDVHLAPLPRPLPKDGPEALPDIQLISFSAILNLSKTFTTQPFQAAQVQPTCGTANVTCPTHSKTVAPSTSGTTVEDCCECVSGYESTPQI